MISTEIIIGLTAIAGLAGTIDAIAGGGGLIQIPALLLTGLPPQIVLGTNKCISTLGTSIAAFSFWKKKKLFLPVIFHGIIFSLLGSFLGSKLVLLVPQEILGKVMIGLLPLGMITLFLKKPKTTTHTTLSAKEKWVKIPLICISLGLYDGFFGPGTGTFLIMGFYILCQRELLESTANAKIFNLASNVGALAIFLLHKKVAFGVAIPMGIAAMGGNYLGTHLAITKGHSFIRNCVVAVMVILTLTLIIKFI